MMSTPRLDTPAHNSVNSDSVDTRYNHSESTFRWHKGKLDIDSHVTDDTEQSIETEIINHFQHHAPPPVLLTNIFLACIASMVMWNLANHVFMIVWVVIHSCIALGNGLAYKAFRERSRDNNHFWYKLFCFGALLNGISWGIGSATLYTPDALLQSMFVILIVAGVSSGVTTVQSSLRAGFLLFTTPALLIPALVILLRFGTDSVFLSFLLVIYFCFITFAGFNNRHMVIETIKLKFEKDQLLQQVHGSERYFRALIENASDLVIVIDKNGTIVFQSPSSRTVLGYRPEELEGMCLYDFVHEDDITNLKSIINYLYEVPGKIIRGEARWLHREGSWLMLEGHGQTMDIDESLIVINARDVTERREIEDELRLAKVKAETANQAKSLFLANMSHEIRTPMHAILAMADVLKETELSDQQSRYVKAFRNAGEHLLSLLNDLLDFSRIEAGELKLANTPFHLPQLIESIFDLMWGEAKNKDITLNYAIANDVAPWHLGDPQRIRQLIVNLVNNAIKFTDDGEVLIRISNQSPDHILVEVRDTGEGICEEHQNLIFDSFAQADTTISERFGGTGLGLAICKRLVEAMDGKIWVQSQPDVGSTFYCELHLPATSEPSEFIDQRERDVALIAAKLPPAAILVADDSAMNRMVIDEYLRYTPCHADFALNGQEAVDKMADKQYDLVLMDLRMPEMDGLSATKTIRAQEQHHESKPTPIIALTAGVLAGDRESALEAGCTDYLAKPVSKDDLTRALVKYL